MTSAVFHYSDTARLPRIFLDGELKPGRNQIGGFPDPDFLWATTSPLGDRTASASGDALRANRVRFVRFTLAAEDFDPWDSVVDRFPAWTLAQARRLERAANGKSDPRTWRCRAEPLPADRWQAVETRTWADKVWRPLLPPWRIMPLDPVSMGVEIGTKVYVSTKIDGPCGAAGYIPTVLSTEDAA